jgi:hypothetical protein
MTSFEQCASNQSAHIFTLLITTQGPLYTLPRGNRTHESDTLLLPLPFLGAVLGAQCAVQAAQR